VTVRDTGRSGDGPRRDEAWKRPGLRTRLVAALISFALAAGLLFILRGARVAARAQQSPDTVAVRIWPSAPIVHLAREPAAVEPRRRDRFAARRPALQAEPISSPRAEPANIPLAHAEPSMPEPTMAASSPASGPLRIEDLAIRRAVAGTEGTVRRLARGSGAELDSPRQRPIDQLGSAIAEGVVPDCLAPRENGNLLLAPIIAIQAIRGKCK